MPDVVSYPHYCPDKRSLRSYLLVYDRLSTIVPRVDQEGVRDREAWAEVSGISDGQALGFFDPTFMYTSWFYHPASQREFERLSLEIYRSKKHKKLIKEITAARDGYLIQENNRSSEDLLRMHGWQYLAMQKFPHEMLEKLLDMRLAFRVDRIQFEATPIIIERRLADFILARLARQVACDEGVAPVSSLKRQMEDLLLDGGAVEVDRRRNHGDVDRDVGIRERRSQLLAVSLDLAIPAGVENLRIGDFWEIRENFAQTRLVINDLVDGLARSLDIDSEQDFGRFCERVQDKRADISSRIENAQGQMRRDRTRNVAIDVIVSATTSGFGAFIGGIHGAMLGAGIAPVVSKYGRLVSTRAEVNDIDSIKQLAVMRNKLTKQARIEAYQRPFYYL